jgi:hypothetical protein
MHQRSFVVGEYVRDLSACDFEHLKFMQSEIDISFPAVEFRVLEPLDRRFIIRLEDQTVVAKANLLR